MLLEWWTYNERGHVILARSERTMQETFARVLDEHSNAEIKSFFEIEVVAPSKFLIDLYSKYDYQDKVQSFKDDIRWRLKEMIEADRPLPAQFKKCPGFEHEDGLSADPDDLKWDADYHRNCKHCYGRIVFGMTDEEMYELYGKRWSESELSRPKSFGHREAENPSRYKREPSRAEQATDDETLWCAVGMFGHHSTGITLVEVEQKVPENFNLRPEYLSNALFFYRQLSVVDFAPLNLLSEEAKKNFAVKKALSEEKSTFSHNKEIEDRINKMLAFFKE